MRSLADFAPANRSPVPLIPRESARSWFTSSRLKNDYQGQMASYGTDPVIYPMVRRLAEAVGKPKWRLFQKSASGLDEDRIPVLTHPVLDLLNRPNRFMSRAQFMEAGQQYSDLTGETDIVVGYVPGVKYPIDMWPVRPDRLTPVPDPYDYLQGWLYEIGGERVPLSIGKPDGTGSEIIRNILPSPLDPYRGMGPIQALMLELDAQRFGKEWQATFFENSARPNGIIELDRHLSDPQFREMQMRWAESHRGLSKAHRVALLEHGAKWVETSFSLRDLQMAEMEEVGRDKKLTAFGFPKFALGIVDDVNRASAEASEYFFAKWLVEPRLGRWREMFNTHLLPLFGADVPRRFELDYESPVPENSEQALAEIGVKVQAYIDLVNAGADEEEAANYLGIPALKIQKLEPVRVPATLGAPAPEIEPGEDPEARHPGFDAAMRWKVQGHDDDSTCDDCRGNFDKLYRSRSAAYADYPGGQGYIKCVGAKYGNKCRCKVVKRRAK